MVLSSRKFTYSLLASSLALVAARGVEAQSNFGAVRGIVSDGVGASLASASVVLTANTTKISRTTIANGSGEYVFSAVEPGTYTVSVTQSGFKKLDRANVIVESGSTDVVDLKLDVGAATEPLRLPRPNLSWTTAPPMAAS